MFHLLLADDNPTIRKIVEASFQGEEIQVSTSENGQAALDFIASSPVGVVLADVSLPGIDGYELCRRIKDDPETASIPVVLLVGAFEQFDDSRARQVGCFTHLVKPVESSKLVEIVRNLIDVLPDRKPASMAVAPHEDQQMASPATDNSLDSRMPALTSCTSGFELLARDVPSRWREELAALRRAAPRGTVAEESSPQPPSQIDPEILYDSLKQRLQNQLDSVLKDAIQDVVRRA